jgi:hypothetical protein
MVKFPVKMAILLTGVVTQGLVQISQGAPFVNDVSKSLRELGNPAESFYPTGNVASVQDMQLFEGRIYVGYGNLDNRVSKKPIYLDPATLTFFAETAPILMEEEVFRRFRVFDSELYIESFDPISPLSSLYRCDANGWQINPMNFPGSGRHNFDIFKYDGWLFTGGGFGFPGIAISADGGTNWTLPGVGITNSIFYDPEFFVFDGQLYASQDLSYAALFPDLSAPYLLKFSGSTSTPFTVVYDRPDDFYPTGDANTAKLSHFESYRGAGAYIGNGGLYVVRSMVPPLISKVPLPNAVGDYVVDLLSRSNGVYYLASIPQSGDPAFPYLGTIGKTEDLQTWTEICRFRAREVVQSFELVDGNFVVGLGNYLTTSRVHSGDVLYIPKVDANETRNQVVPAAFELVDGNVGELVPFGANQSSRVQQVFASATLSQVTGPQIITAMAFRPHAPVTQGFTSTIANVQIDLSTTTTSPPTLSTQFPTNLGTNTVTVFVGPLLLSSKSPNGSFGTRQFDVEIRFQKPFIFDPASGNLLVDIRNFDGGTFLPLDAVEGVGLPMAQLVSSIGGANSPTGVVSSPNIGLVTRFTTRSVASSNQAPTVSAGLNQTVNLPSMALLEGSILDDSRPNAPGLVTSLWSQVSGPGIVVLDSPSNLNTTAQFPRQGKYTLQLRAGDGLRMGTGEVAITALPIPRINLPPVVSAGADQIVVRTNRTTGKTNAVQLNGLVADDGFPQPPGLTTNLWYRVSGPGLVEIEAARTPSTLVRFSDAGLYVFRLVASDGELSASNDVSIIVLDGSTTNQPPSVNAGPDRVGSTAYPTVLHGVVTDDTVVTTAVSWMKVAGPGTVQFDNISNLNAMVSIAQAGHYVLRLIASDGNAQASDDMSIDVVDTLTVVVPNGLATTSGRGGNGFPLNISSPVRYQQIYAASQFPSNTGPFLISEIAFRPSSTSGGAFTSTVQQLIVELSTTQVSPYSGPLVLFADNIGTDKQGVFHGSVTMSSSFAGSSTKAFDVILPLQRPFLYDPRVGNLLVDIRNVYGGQTTFLDGTWGTGLPTSRIVSRPDGLEDERGQSDASPTALVTRFTLWMTPAPNLTVGLDPGRVRVLCKSIFGQRLILQASSNLMDWTLLESHVPLFAPVSIEDDSDQPRQFYRAYISP